MQAFNISGFASPFISLYKALKTLDTTRVPLALSWVNVVNSTLWTAYGILLGDPWIWAPNIAGIAIATLQLIGLAYINYRLWTLKSRAAGNGQTNSSSGKADSDLTADDLGSEHRKGGMPAAALVSGATEGTSARSSASTSPSNSEPTGADSNYAGESA